MSITLPPFNLITTTGGPDGLGPMMKLDADHCQLSGFDHLYGDGYDWMDQMQEYGWVSIPAWGRDGWDMGQWPYVSYMIRRGDDEWAAVNRTEGDLLACWFKTKEAMIAWLDEAAAFWFARSSHDSVREDYLANPDDPKWRDPYSRERSAA